MDDAWAERNNITVRTINIDVLPWKSLRLIFSVRVHKVSSSFSSSIDSTQRIHHCASFQQPDAQPCSQPYLDNHVLILKRISWVDPVTSVTAHQNEICSRGLFDLESLFY
jgi:hypothetical protein